MSEFNPEQPRGYRGRKRSPQITSRLPEKPPFRLTRRAFLKGAAAVGIAALATQIDLDKFGIEPTSDEAKHYQTTLSELDRKIIDIESFEEIAPQVGELAVEYFSQEMGYDARSYQGRLHFLRDGDYKKRMRETGCIERPSDESQIAFVHALLPDMFFNLNAHLEISRNRAQMLFQSILHELFHVSAPTLVNTETTPQTKTKGLLILQPNPEKSKPGDICHDTLAFPLEEAIVTDATDRMLQKLGLKKMLPDHDKDYKMWVERYRRGIIDKLFGGDHKPLLDLHQETRQQDFFSLIGQKLGDPAGQAARVADEYTYQVLIEGR